MGSQHWAGSPAQCLAYNSDFWRVDGLGLAKLLGNLKAITSIYPNLGLKGQESSCVFLPSLLLFTTINSLCLPLPSLRVSSRNESTAPRQTDIKEKVIEAGKKT